MKNTTKIFAKLIVFCFVLFPAICVGQVDATKHNTAQNDQNNSEKKPKNVIIMIGDGCGFNSYIAGSYWRNGELGKQAVDKFPVLVGVSTFSITKAGQPDHAKGYDPKVIWADLGGARAGTDSTTVTDSSSAATAIYSGQKTYNGAMGVGFDKQPIKTLPQFVEKLGKSTGAISTVEISHATPGAFGSHHEKRDDYAIIFNQMFYESPLSVMFGAGHPFYANGKERTFGLDKDGKPTTPNYAFLGGEETWNKLSDTKKKDDFYFFDSKEEFVRMAETGKTDKTIPNKVVGILRDTECAAPIDGAPNNPNAADIFNKRYGTVAADQLPTLSEMTTGAMNLLARNEKGFVLMVEGGAIDWANHSRDIERSVMEVTGFNKAVEAAIDWIEKNSSWDETLLIVTADHETGNLWGPDTYEDVNNNGVYDKGDKFIGFQPIKNNGLGKIPSAQYGAGDHSNLLVPLWAKGAGAELFEQKIRGTDTEAAKHFGIVGTQSNNFHGQYIDNTDIIRNIMLLLDPNIVK
ncbi:MAG: alkaline phosphatase [Thermoguttaceae bacterium]